MVNIGNYILYMDSTYSIKVKSFDGEGTHHFPTRRYFVDGIETEFFILAVFVDNKRQDGFEFDNTHPDTDYHTDNLFMKSIINDLGMTDLNMIPLNHFLQANKKVMFQVGQSFSTAQIVDIYNTSPYVVTKNFSAYGLVKPTYVVKQHIPSSRNVRSLVVTHMGSYNGLTQATIFDRGFANGSFVNQFIGLNSDPDDGFQFYPEDSICFGIDDINILIVFLGNQAKYFEFDIETLIDDNIVKLSLSDGYRVSRVQPYAYSKTQWQFVIDKLLPNSNDIDFTFHVYIDWKVLPQIA